MMKTAIVAALSVGALVAFPAAVNAAETPTDTTHAIVETVLNDLGVDASAELVDLIAADVDPVLLNAGLVDAVDTALAEGTDPTQVIDDITEENFDEQSVLWEENGDEWTATAPAVRPNRHSSSGPDDDSDTDADSDNGESDGTDDTDATSSETPTQRPSATPRPTNTSRPGTTPRPTSTESDDDGYDDDDDRDDDHSDDDD